MLDYSLWFLSDRKWVQGSVVCGLRWWLLSEIISARNTDDAAWLGRQLAKGPRGSRRFHGWQLSLLMKLKV